MKKLMVLGALAAPLFAAPEVEASPQWNAGVVTSLCGLGEDGEYFQELGWCNALHADLLFGRSRNSDFAIGPYVDLSTRDFDDFRWGGGASLLVPAVDDFPLILRVGPYVNGVENLGLATALFWGLRTYNFHGSYEMGAGLVVGAQHDFDSRRQTTLTAGVQIDALWLALPFLFLYGLASG